MRDSVPNVVSAAVDSLSAPAYVGENRCWPCAVLNLWLVGAAAVAAAVASTALAASVAVVGTALVALRGYVVPYTPRFAPRLAAAVPVSVPGHSPPRFETESVAPRDADGEAVLAALARAGVVREESALALDEAFYERWLAEIEALRGREELAGAVEATLPGVAAERRERGSDVWFALRRADGDASEALSYPIALADVAAVRALTDAGVPEGVALRATAPLRQFLATCPACEGDLGVRDDACCGGFGPGGPDRVLACDDCRAAVFAFEGEAAPDPDGAA